MQFYLAILILILAFCPRHATSLEYRESTSPAEYERIIRAIDASRDSRAVREGMELRELIDKAIRERREREAWEHRS